MCLRHLLSIMFACITLLKNIIITTYLFSASFILTILNTTYVAYIYIYNMAFDSKHIFMPIQQINFNITNIKPGDTKHGHALHNINALHQNLQFACCQTIAAPWKS